MRNLYNLIVSEKSAILIDPKCNTHILSKITDINTFKKIRVNLILNSSELDISCVKFPEMSFWDRQKYKKTRKKYKTGPFLYGAYIHKNVLVEFSCPQYDLLSEWIKSLVKQGHKVVSIKPFILTPQVLDSQFSLVLSDHDNNGLRQTIFEGQTPIFTRVTQSSCEDILTTLTYIKNHYNAKQINVEGYTEASIIDQLKRYKDPQILLGPLLTNQKAEKNYIKQLTASFKVGFPFDLEAQRKTKFLNKLAVSSYILSLFLIIGAGWQRISFQKLSQQGRELSYLIEQQQISLESSSLENQIPSMYRKVSKENGPLPLLSTIAQCLPEDIRVRRITWHNSVSKEICEFEVRLVHDTMVNQKVIEKIKELEGSLRRSLKNYKVKVTSMPYQSSDYETFSGTASLKQLDLKGEAQKAQIRITREK